MINTTYLEWLRDEIRDVNSSSGRQLARNARTHIQNTHRWISVDGAYLTMSKKLLADCEQLAALTDEISVSGYGLKEAEKLRQAALSNLNALIKEGERCGPSSLARSLAS